MLCVVYLHVDLEFSGSSSQASSVRRTSNTSTALSRSDAAMCLSRDEENEENDLEFVRPQATPLLEALSEVFTPVRSESNPDCVNLGYSICRELDFRRRLGVRSCWICIHRNAGTSGLRFYGSRIHVGYHCQEPRDQVHFKVVF